MKKNGILKTPILAAFPLVGSAEENKSRKIRAAKEQPYPLNLFGVRLSREALVPFATNILAMDQKVADVKNGVVDILFRRTGSVAIIQVAVQKLEKQAHVKAASNGHASHAKKASSKKAYKAKQTKSKKQPKSAPQTTEATAAAA